jgi:serine phosphatase RsbU (regulator of sigma subunit)
LKAGDLLMLFTDGLYDVEGPNQDSAALDWLVGEVQRAPVPPLCSSINLSTN